MLLIWICSSIHRHLLDIHLSILPLLFSTSHFSD